jgi:hypothetical protein
MLGFKRVDAAAVTISGIELAAKIRKQQFKVGSWRDRRRRFRQSGPPSLLRNHHRPVSSQRYLRIVRILHQSLPVGLTWKDFIAAHMSVLVGTDFSRRK